MLLLRADIACNGKKRKDRFIQMQNNSNSKNNSENTAQNSAQSNAQNKTQSKPQNASKNGAENNMPLDSKNCK